jgi:hypothetical protein
VVHPITNYPGIPGDHSTIKENHGVPIRPQFGVARLQLAAGARLQE